MKSTLPIIHTYYRDIGEQGPRLGCGFFTLHRKVTSIHAVPGGEAGSIQYQGRTVPVYRRDGSIWSTSPSALHSPKAFYL